MPSYKAATPTFTALIPEGDYLVRVTGAALARAKSGNNMIELKLIVEGPEHVGTTLIERLVFTPSVFWKIDQFRAATGDKIVEGEDVNVDAQFCVGRKGWVSVITEEYNGKPQNKVDSWLDPKSIKDAGIPF